jgi:Type II secretion system (T2SS), protein E, N-terminal domain
MDADQRSQEALFGKLLGRRVPLSHHDIHEILEEQSGSRRRFGQIALAWGLCEPQHIWATWAEQLTERTPRVDLARIGVDVQATLQVSRAVAAELGIVPVRAHPGGLVVAASERTIARAAERLAKGAGGRITFVLAEPSQIREALIRYYPDLAIPARTSPDTCADRPCADRCAGPTCRRRRLLMVPDTTAPMRTAS